MGPVPYAAYAVAAAASVGSILIVVYVGLAVAVALFHPDHRRRHDARAVLASLVAILPRNRRELTTLADGPNERSSPVPTPGLSS